MGHDHITELVGEYECCSVLRRERIRTESRIRVL